MMSGPFVEAGPPAPKTVDFHVRVSEDDAAAIDAWAVADRRKRSDMVRVLLAEAVAARRSAGMS